MMNQLKKDLNSVLHDNNMAWVDEINRAKETKSGINLLKLFLL